MDHEQKLKIYNSLTRQVEEFEPLNPPFVGLYNCGPTVYGDPHLGHARAAITFDVLYRYLIHLGYKVRYVRNITDVGHLENDADDGEDKVAKKARLEHLEPMEIAQRYTNTYHEALRKLNCLPPSIEPLATGHIPEQIKMVEAILKNSYAYESNGSIYFDVQKYAKGHDYGRLSGKVLDDLLSGSRELEGQQEKRSPVDFALWKKASKEHIMKWDSPWGEGFPGWHLECSVMSAKYLGIPFDIHGGGLDLTFPHHECEIAQSESAYEKAPCKYWMHNNMITINQQKMSKSLGNFITIEQLFSGEHEKLTRAYDPMTLRFFILQAHYRSTIDFSNEALIAAEKGLERLMDGLKTLDQINPGETSTLDIDQWIYDCYEVLNDDLNTAKLIAKLFDGVRWINNLKEGNEKLNEKDLKAFREAFHTFTYDILGLQITDEGVNSESLEKVMELLINLRQEAREKKDFALSDKIRDELKKYGIILKDGKDGTDWRFE